MRSFWGFGSFVVVVAAALLLGGCFDFPSEPVFPSWDVDVSVALTKTSHSVRGMIEELSGLPPELLDSLDLSGWSGVYIQSVDIGDTTGDGINDTGFSSDFFADVHHADIFVEAANGSPVELGVYVELVDSSGQIVLGVPETGSLITLPPAPVDAAGKTGPATRMTSVVSLDREAVAGLERASHLHYSIRIEVPDGVSFRNIAASDTVGVRAWGTFRTTVNR